jgi:hypothetical protein
MQNRVAERGGRVRWWAGLVLLLVTLTLASPASSDEYDPKEAGHPLRVAAYIAHPVGVVLDYLIMRPAFWVGGHQPFRTIFGRDG